MKKILTAENYYEADDYMSVSTWKALNKCEVSGLVGYGGTPIDSMLVSSYVDAYIEGTLDKFKEEHPETICQELFTQDSQKIS